jgi:hypothetical protein
MIEIDVGESEQARREPEGAEHRHAEAEPEREPRREQAGQQLDDRVARRDRRPTVAATTAQPEPASTGPLSYQRIALPQLGQCDPGETIDSTQRNAMV